MGHQAVFLSYTSEDAEVARRICDSCRAAGLEVWFDQSELHGGDAWDQQIRRQIRDCALFVAIISAHTDVRPEGYFRREWRLAVDRTLDMADDQAFLLPVAIDSTAESTARVPDRFREVQWSRLADDKALSALVERIASLLSPGAATTPSHALVGDSRPPLLRAAASSGTRPPAALGPAAGVARDMVADKSIAVLAFANLSADKESEYFSDGLAEEILNALSQVENLHVASRGSSFFFKGKATEMREIGARLNVATVLDGSVRRAGNRLRVTVQLVDASNGFQLWSERYDRQMEDTFEIQDDIAKAVTERLKVTLGTGSRQSTTNIEAYELYLQGRHYWHQRLSSAMPAAIRCFERSIALDPKYGLAYAGLADCYGILRAFGNISGEAGRAPALAAVTQAMALAPELWEVNFSRGFYTFHFERAWREAEPYFRKAIAINSRASLAHIYLGFLLVAQGRTDEAVMQATLARELDPLSPVTYGHAASILNAVGHFDAAERAARRAIELQPDFILGLTNCGGALCGLGRSEEAIEPLERAVVLSRAPLIVAMAGYGYAQCGRFEDARRLLRELEDRGSRGEYIPAFAPLGIYLGFGLGELPAVRVAFAKSLAETVSPNSITWFRLEAFRTDPEIDRLHIELFGW